MASDIPSTLAQPALRALKNAGITSLDQLAKHTKAEVLALHGMGPNAMKKLEEAMAAAGISFAK